MEIKQSPTKEMTAQSCLSFQNICRVYSKAVRVALSSQIQSSQNAERPNAALLLPIHFLGHEHIKAFGSGLE